MPVCFRARFRTPKVLEEIDPVESVGAAPTGWNFKTTTTMTISLMPESWSDQQILPDFQEAETCRGQWNVTGQVEFLTRLEDWTAERFLKSLNQAPFIEATILLNRMMAHKTYLYDPVGLPMLSNQIFVWMFTAIPRLLGVRSWRNHHLFQRNTSKINYHLMKVFCQHLVHQQPSAHHSASFLHPTSSCPQFASQLNDCL
jgi:hypothetical protein